jgi:hypothetical protein
MNWDQLIVIILVGAAAKFLFYILGLHASARLQTRPSSKSE